MAITSFMGALLVPLVDSAKFGTSIGVVLACRPTCHFRLITRSMPTRLLPRIMRNFNDVMVAGCRNDQFVGAEMMKIYAKMAFCLISGHAAFPCRGSLAAGQMPGPARG
jgi:hypothetical protein